jgi:hypothetical protein
VSQPPCSFSKQFASTVQVKSTSRARSRLRASLVHPLSSLAISNLNHRPLFPPRQTPALYPHAPNSTNSHSRHCWNARKILPADVEQTCNSSQYPIRLDFKSPTSTIDLSLTPPSNAARAIGCCSPELRKPRGSPHSSTHPHPFSNPDSE